MQFVTCRTETDAQWTHNRSVRGTWIGRVYCRIKLGGTHAPPKPSLAFVAAKLVPEGETLCGFRCQRLAHHHRRTITVVMVLVMVRLRLERLPEHNNPCPAAC